MMKMKASYKKEENNSDSDKIDVSADVAALIKDEDLSETFKNKAATIFEAAVNAKVKEQKEKIQAAYDEKLQEDIESQKGELVTKVDSYLNYVVEEWMKENSIAIERGIKGEIAEDFISGLKKLFEDHYIDVPDEKYNVLEDQASKIEELEKKLNEQVDKNVEQNKAMGEVKRQNIIDEASKDLADTAKEKFNKLAEEVEYSSEKDFTTKIDTIKESYFGKKVETSGNEIDDVVAGDSSQPEDLSNAMAAYTAAISKTKDIKLSNK
jgi:SHS2 domain-containing protein